MSEGIFRRLEQAIGNCDPELARQLAKEALTNGVDPLEAIEKGLSRGMAEVGRKYEAREYFLPDLIMGGEAFKAALEVLEPELLRKMKTRTIKGKVLLGTVAGDLHNLGKDIVGALLRAAGYDVYDLGVDVPSSMFLDSAKVQKPNVLGMSTLLTSALFVQREVIAGLREAGLRKGVKVIIGGAATSENWAKEIGVDDFAESASLGVKKIEKLVARSAN